MDRISDTVFQIYAPVKLQACWVYYIGAAPLGASIEAAALWSTANGILLFANKQIEAARSEVIAASLRRSLRVPQSPTAPWRMMAWIDDPASPALTDALYASQTAQGIFSIRRAWNTSLGRFGIQIAPSLTLRFEPIDGLPAIRLSAAPRDVGLVSFTVDGQPLRVGYSHDGFDIPIRLEGTGAGSLQIAVGIDPSVLIAAFRCGFLYSTNDSSIFFPMVPAILRTVDRMRAFSIWLNPIRVLDENCTRFSIDDSAALRNPGFPRIADVPDPFDAPYFSSTIGGPITLRPFDPGPTEPNVMPGGFAFSVDARNAPVTLAIRGLSPEALYLSPCGSWVVADPTSTLCLMPGTFGNEFLKLGPDDRLWFQSNRSLTTDVWAGGAPRCDGSDTTTSWVSVIPSASSPAAYYGQPSASSFFGALGHELFPLALDVQLAEFTAPSAPFPLVPYGGVYQPVPEDRHTHYPPPFAGDPERLLRLEAAVLANTRHALLARASRGPVFRIGTQSNAHLGPAATSHAAVTRQNSAWLDRAVTPQGLLLDVGRDGTASRLTLARSPPSGNADASFLSFDATAGQVLPPSLTNALTRDQAFLIVSTLPSDMGSATFANLLDLTGFNLEFDVGGKGGTILVFKFNTRSSLAELAAQPSAWADAATFNADPDAIGRRLLRAIADAEALGRAAAALPAAGVQTDAIDSFAAFNALAGQAEWTGILAFDVQINGNGMPLDLQILLGGIQGDLRAHHLGVQVNRFTAGDGGNPSLVLAESALFGVVHYQAPADAGPPVGFPDYEVEHLRIAWSNSRIVQSDVKIGVTFDSLFGRKIWLQGPRSTDPSDAAPPNTLKIAGTSQTVDGIATVSFSTATPFIFAFHDPAGATSAIRVIDRLVVMRARLVPIGSSQPSKTEPTAVTLHLLLDGRIFFAADPFPGVSDEASGIDLFSYGAGDEGLAFTGLAVEIAFELDRVTGSMKDGSKTVSLREDLLTLSPKLEALRGGSFLASFPVQVSRFVAAPSSPLPAAMPGAQAVHVLQLEPTPSRGPPSTTPTPVYSLECDVHLGTAGALSDDHAGLTAKMFVGWGPNAAQPEDDAAGLLMVLPQLSGGVAGFSLQGLLKTKIGDANMLCVDVAGRPVYAIQFGDIRLSFLGYDFPPGNLVDFTLFAGAPSAGGPASNLAWFLAAKQAP